MSAEQQTAGACFTYKMLLMDFGTKEMTELQHNCDAPASMEHPAADDFYSSKCIITLESLNED